MKKANSPKGNNNIFITGFMGSGKTTVGKVLAKKLNRKFIDLDEAIEDFMDKKIYEIIEKFGEDYFRKIENQQLALACKEKETVIALGGGSLIAPKNQYQIRRSGSLVHLWANESTLMSRLENTNTRPLLKSGKGLRELYEERKPGYALANVCVQADERSPERIASNIINELERMK